MPICVSEARIPIAFRNYVLSSLIYCAAVPQRIQVMASTEVLAPSPTTAVVLVSTSRQGRPLQASQKRKEADATEHTGAVVAPEKPKKKKAGTKKGDADNVDEDTIPVPEGVNDPEASKQKKKEKESKDKACKWLRAEQRDKGIVALEGRPHIVTTSGLDLVRPGGNGAPAHTQDLVPGDSVTVWTDKPALRKNKWAVYRIEKGAQADHWHIRCRLQDEASLTSFPVANITGVIKTDPKETVDERTNFLKVEDQRLLEMAQKKKEDENIRAKQKKKLKKQQAVTPRERVTPGDILRPSDFQEAMKSMQQMTANYEAKRAEDHALLRAAIEDLKSMKAELAKKLVRLEKVKEGLTNYGMNRHTTVGH